MRLYHVEFTYYGPEDSQDGTRAWVLAEDDKALERWLARESDLDFSDGNEDEDEENIIYPPKDWLAAHPDALDRARAVGLDVNERWGFPSVSGSHGALLRWRRADLRGDDDSSFIYHPVYRWDEGRDVTDEEAAVLAKFIAVYADEAPHVVR